jgi:hypothetical protein
MKLSRALFALILCAFAAPFIIEAKDSKLQAADVVIVPEGKHRASIKRHHAHKGDGKELADIEIVKAPKSPGLIIAPPTPDNKVEGEGDELADVDNEIDIEKTVEEACKFEYKVGGVFKPESFAGDNISLLNNRNCGFDKVWYARHTLDLSGEAKFKKGNEVVAEAFGTVRNRGTWGNPGGVMQTTDAITRVVDTVGGTHSHSISRHLLWVRECWLKFDIAQAVALSFTNKHQFTLGLFPFQLGRGIALGDAYAVGPEFLGFYTDFVVDQYAPGAKFSGDIVPKMLSYDLYAAIFQNKSSSLGDTGAKILGQQYGLIANPGRGFGKINYLVAGRLMWHLVNNDSNKVNLEPYALYNNDPEQKIEFLADSNARLGTIGLAGNYINDRVEFGFDTAVNFGQQHVKGWDRNVIKEANVDGRVSVVNSHVVSEADGSNIPFIKGSPAQKIIESSYESQSENGQVIGAVDGPIGYLTPGPITLQNKNFRFRDPYNVGYHGWMFVSDIAFWFQEHTLRLAAEAGAASGGRHPHGEAKTCSYDGFVGLQEIYSGNKVKSAFVLGGAGKLPRPLATPESDAVNPFSVKTSGFTNLVYGGSSILWKPKLKREFNVQSNIIAYWDERAIKKFDAFTKSDLACNASKFLGVETNMFMNYYPFTSTKFFFVGSLFFPGQHYTDIRGKPLNPEQEAALNELDRTDFEGAYIPNVGHDMAWTINAGIEFKF